MVKEKLRNSDIYTEKITDGYFNSRVAMPNVKEGSVIDLEFKVVGVPYDWHFQETIPVVWSEMKIEPYSTFRFRKYFYGFEPLFIQSDYRWVAKDVPAFKDEPFMNSRENYMTKFDFDMYSLILFYLAPDWNAISFQLENSSNFGIALKASRYLNDIADEIEHATHTDEEKIAAAYDTIKRIKWDHNQNLFASNPNLSYTFKKGIGNSADINLSLLQLIKKLGIEAYPVVLSTRKNGMLSPSYVAFRKLNHVIVYVKTAEKTYMLDATEDYSPFDLLPEKCLNWQGRLVNGDQSRWIDLTTDKKDKELVYYNLHAKKGFKFYRQFKSCQV